MAVLEHYIHLLAFLEVEFAKFVQTPHDFTRVLKDLNLVLAQSRPSLGRKVEIAALEKERLELDLRIGNGATPEALGLALSESDLILALFSRSEFSVAVTVFSIGCVRVGTVRSSE